MFWRTKVIIFVVKSNKNVLFLYIGGRFCVCVSVTVFALRSCGRAAIVVWKVSECSAKCPQKSCETIAKVGRNGRKSHAASVVMSVHHGRYTCSSRSTHVFITTVTRDFSGRFARLSRPDCPTFTASPPRLRATPALTRQRRRMATARRTGAESALTHKEKRLWRDVKFVCLQDIV